MSMFMFGFLSKSEEVVKLFERVDEKVFFNFW